MESRTRSLGQFSGPPVRLFRPTAGPIENDQPLQAFSANVTAGVLGQAPNGGWAGFFEGSVYVNGTLSGPDKAFLVDNPANPEAEYLQHSVLESDERRNMYDGVVTLDADGKPDTQQIRRMANVWPAMVRPAPEGDPIEMTLENGAETAGESRDE